MSFDGNEGSFITIDEASKLTQRFRNAISPGDVIGLFIGRQKIIEILNQPESIGIRFYFGVNEEERQTLVLVGTDTNGDDLVEGKIVDRGYPCPTICGNRNALNS